ncbi:MAG: PepSY domain-containing protein [Lachnospiraceae bacterium oral taxon 082]|nr:PepSY domain-containing protein [Lachnospiraceae bacterium oral taxon 082]
MKREDIEKKLDTAVSGMIPEDMFKRISENIVSVDAERIEKGMKKKFNIFSKGFVGVAAAACILFAVGVVGVPYYGNNYVPDSHVDIDVNPGVEIVTNKKNKVLEVQSTNQDGASVIDGMDLKNTELKVAVNALIGSMVQKGYLQNDNTGILVTVRNDNEDRANKIKAEVLNDINTALLTNSVKAIVMNQIIKSPVVAKKFATENNISIGKAVFILNLTAKDSSLDAKELAKMKVSEIASLVVQKGIDIRDIVDYDSDDSIWENIADAIEDIDEDAREKGISTSAAVENTTVSATTAAQPQPAATTAVQPKANNTSGDIGVEKAKEIAMSHAGVSAGSLSFVKAKLDYEDGVKVYDIEFYSGNVEYDYEINAATGAIVSFDQDIENYAIPTQPAAPTQAAASGISADRAKQIALSHAGVSGASFTKVELDTDDGVRVYEIEFKVGNVEYDYDIDATSGAILSSSSEIDD